MKKTIIIFISTLIFYSCVNNSDLKIPKNIINNNVTTTGSTFISTLSGSSLNSKKINNLINKNSSGSLDKRGPSFCKGNLDLLDKRKRDVCNRLNK